MPRAGGAAYKIHPERDLRDRSRAGVGGLWMTGAKIRRAAHAAGMPLDTRRPFTRAAALAAGISDARLRSAACQRLFTAVYLAAGVEVTPRIRAAAALLAVGRPAFASHATAARVWRVPIPTLPEDHVTVAARTDRCQRAGLVCHVAPSGTAPRTVAIDGVRVSAPEQLFVELASQIPLVGLVVVGDHLVRRGHLTLARLQEFVASWTGPRAAHARAAVAFVRERVDSPMETRLRMLIVLAGLPEPVVNLTYGEQDGLVFRKYDLSWPAVRLIVEYDDATMSSASSGGSPTSTGVRRSTTRAGGSSS